MYGDEHSITVNLDKDNYIPVSVGGLPITALVDTGAQINTISSALLSKLQNRSKVTVYQSEYAAVTLADGAKRAALRGKVYILPWQSIGVDFV